ncbi:uncharacterized protein LOC116141447 [Pistacia vera]|uniref:uncharacterized protein LOC116141447 n=1 Tax=Pistacia vera TaxID=55513 RepID=UPI0012631FCC|nr:uncharacterized protein LOC116141447 [Pistacia vera]XP_031282806.1 uncharacterized protein LOC116141447 [Pistacia vera]
MYAIGLQVSNRSVPCSGPELCKPAGLPNSEAIYGRDVTDESDLVNFSIMPTIGMAGICKPSLARLEYNDEAVEDFKPEESDVSRISKAILEPVTSKSCDLKDVNDLAASILAGLLCTLSGLMNDKANLTGDPECFKGEIIGGGNTKFNWSKDICVF